MTTRVVLALFLLSALALAQSCSNWNTTSFLRSVTVAGVRACIEEGGNVHDRTSQGYTPLHWVAQYTGDPAIIKVLVEAGATVDARTKKGWTPLHLAARHNDNPAVSRTLFEVGAWANARDEDGKTPLHWAAEHNDNPEIVTAFLEAGVEPTIRDNNGWTPLSSAVFGGGPEVLRILLNMTGANVSDPLPLALAAAGNPDPEIITMLLDTGFNVNELVDGTTPLHLAVEYNPNPDVIAILLDAGADGKVKDRDSKIPWDYALDREAYLLARNADVFWRLNEARFESR